MPALADLKLPTLRLSGSGAGADAAQGAPFQVRRLQRPLRGPGRGGRRDPHYVRGAARRAARPDHDACAHGIGEGLAAQAAAVSASRAAERGLRRGDRGGTRGGGGSARRTVRTAARNGAITASTGRG